MKLTFQHVDATGPQLAILTGVLAVLLAGGAWAFFNMEHHGHIVTGMNNQIVWGLPHVFAVFLIVAASGALNVASIGSVFGKMEYKPFAPLSALLALALLLGGLSVLLLDLGRPDRMIIAMTHYNFKSIFAWNIFLYTGYMAIIVAYLWTLLVRAGATWNRPAGFLAFGWRILLTTGTGSIFGFLVAREAFDSALYAPLFITLSLSYGTAIFVIVLAAVLRATGETIAPAMMSRLRSLLVVFIISGLWFAAVLHLTSAYMTKHHGIVRFILLDGGVITAMFWLGQIVLGSLAPIALLMLPKVRDSKRATLVAAVCVVLGGLAQMYVTIIGGQAYPQFLFPGYVEASSFFDGVIHHYQPTVFELLLGLGGVAVAISILTLGLRLFAFAPYRLPAD
jgi:molybdopterin-containing oxidoreductase family membrane subunit